MHVGPNEESPTLEEVLASLRRVLRDEGSLEPLPPTLSDAVEDDFELPALFRVDHPRQAPHYAAAIDSPTQVPDPQFTHGAKLRASDKRPQDLAERISFQNRPDLSLSSLRAFHATPLPPGLPAAPSEQPRIMRSCKDIHIARMSATTLLIEPSARDESSSRVKRSTLPRYRAAADGVASGSTCVPLDQVNKLIGMMVASHFNRMSIDLLRPILEEWFAANASTIFESALRDIVCPTE